MHDSSGAVNKSESFVLEFLYAEQYDLLPYPDKSQPQPADKKEDVERGVVVIDIF